MSSIVSSATPAPSDGPSGSPYPLDGENSPNYFWFFVTLTIELSVLACLVFVTRYTVQHRSGLNEPDKIRRIWARASDIRFQPVTKPLIFAIAVSYGAQSVLHGLVNVLLSIFNVEASHLSLIGLVVSLISVGGSSVIAVLVYRACGGTNWKVCAVSTFAFDWFMAGVILNFARFSGSFKMFGALCLLYFLILAVIQTPCYIWGAYRRMPATARLIYNSSVVPNWVKLDRSVAVATPPLMVIFMVAYLCESKTSTKFYFGKIVFSLAGLMVLACAALASIISVNRALLSNEFQWQWRAFITPSVPLGAANLVLMAFKLVTGRLGFWYAVWFCIHFYLTCGSCGVLGAYVYLKWAELYAQAHIDDDVLAQDDLLAEFEEDEDNEELDV